MREGLYDRPNYYDIAFGWDLSREVRTLETLFRRHVRFRVRNLLEPACGTGRFLVALPGHGYRITGYDLNPAMVAYARRKIARAGVQNRARVVVADMRTARLGERFDAAFNPINSINYLLSDDDVLSHLRVTHESLRPGGVYLVELSTAWDRLPKEDDEGWVEERDRVRVRTVWSIEREDRQRRLSYQRCRMEIRDRGRRHRLTDRHVMRLWFLEDLRRLAEKAGFRLAAIYDQKLARCRKRHISGEMWNMWYVLAKPQGGK